MVSISVIIPTLNEAAYLGRTLGYLSLLSPSPEEIIVVDGGSQDASVAIAEAAGVSVICSEQAGRSQQMNRGAEVARGDILCFLHADTLMFDDAIALMETVLADPTVACGGFISLMAGVQTTRWSISLHNYLKTYYAPLIFRPHLFFFKGLRLLFGDQTMFCRRKDFWDCGGFDPNLPIMEEADLCLKLVNYGRIRLVNRIVQSSDRRVANWGVFKANAIYLYIGFLWGLGVSSSYLKQFYQDVR